MNIKALKANLHESFRALAILLLLAFYATGNIEMDAIHSLVHPTDSVAHTPEQEQEACHRTIYHNEQENGCDHATHLTKIEHCPLCHVVFHIDQLSFSNSSFEFVETDVEDAAQYIAHQYSKADIILPARAPPVV